MAYDYPGSCAPSRWLPSAPKQTFERGPFGLAHRGRRASPMRAASGCLPPAVRIIPQYVPGFQPRFGACCQSRAIYYQQTSAACRAAFRRVKVRVSALARRSPGCFIEQFSRRCGGATFAARLRELSAFGSRQAPWHESPPSRCTKTPTAWASLKGGAHLFVSFRVLRRQVFVTRCS